jgi:hypothetical protein
MNPLFRIELWLIVLTLVVSGMSYRSQKRAGIREAIEQLDPRFVQYRIKGTPRADIPARDVQVKAGLNGFNLRKGECTISFISNRIKKRSDRAVGHSVPPYHLPIKERNADRVITLEERLVDHDLVESVSRDDTQLVVTCSSINPVECRQVANHVLNEHDYSATNLVHDDEFSPWPDQ